METVKKELKRIFLNKMTLQNPTSKKFEKGLVTIIAEGKFLQPYLS